ncbi:hypothetical protein Pmani_023640 [Petrolisthes manimaculis]|uniref:Synphilin-1 n=1 Tax=Petrolisthes manimaculis TaxID=1843537 RepID=A0AAE1U361_9EUCA|nr:hypothetical protein Pmani_023640 [Petrolisthes manimaculis]
MGTRSPRLPYSVSQERCDPEEYDFEDALDTYSLPVDATPAAAAAAAAASAAAAAAAARQGGGEVYRRPVFGSPPAVRRARRPDQPVRPPDQPTRPLDHHDHPASSCPCPLHTSAVKRSRSRERLLAMGDLEGVLSSSLGVGAPAPSSRTGAAPAGNNSNAGRSGGSGSIGGLGLPSANPSTGRTGAVNRGGKGGGGRAGRRSVHQPGFLKTVSIIDTLSELAHGPEVCCLAQEPQPRPSRTHSSSRASSSRQAAGATSAGGGGDLGDDTPPRPPGPPVLSADFQQYSEKVYDAVTAPDPDPGLRGRVTGRAPSHPQPRRRTRPLPRGETSLDDSQMVSVGQEVRREDDDTGRRLRPDPRGRERGRTPDWIKRIFDIAKKGDLPSLKRSVADMEGTLIRNLSDHGGNNLLHVMAVFGHLAPLTWLITTHQVLVDALHDENKFGLTPLVCAIKYGRLRLVQWLVENTGVRDKVRCKDGERSLLHIAAKYAQEEVVSWVVEYMMVHQVPLDNKDHNGNTALHLAARTGNATVCSILLQHGGDVTLKNDLGQKAWEVCVVRGHLACAEYLCVHESGLSLATDLTRREAELEAAMADNHDLRINFKEVLGVARRLVKEREDAVRELSRLQDHMVEAHDNIIMALQVLAEENTSLRDRVNGVRQSTHAREQVESVIEYVNGLHERWQSAQKSWFGSSLVDMEHRLLLVEEAWKKLRHRSHRTVATTHHPLDVFRAKLCSIRAQGGDCRLGDLPSLCSSEESLVSLFPFSEDEDVYEGVEDYCIGHSPGQASPARPTTLTSTPVRPSSSGGGESRAHTLPPRLDALPPRSGTRPEASQDPDYLSRSEVALSDTPSAVPDASSRTPTSKGKEGSTRPYWADASLGPGLGLISEQLGGGGTPGERLGREEISARLRELALTSESGSCSVMEVLVPSTDESDAPPEDETGPPDSQSGSRGLPLPRASEESSSGETQALRPSQDRRQKRGPRSRHDTNDNLGRSSEVATTSSESGGDSCGVKLQESRDLHLHNAISPEHKHFLVNETSPGAAAADVSDACGQRHLCDGEGVEVGKEPPGVYKRKGFLHKFSIKPRWPSKRKVKTVRKVPEISARDFQETYGVRESTLSLADTDAHTTTESNTSSSQEYSNSSEESSIGKPTTSTTTITSSTTNTSTITSRVSDLPEAEAARHRSRSGDTGSASVASSSVGAPPPSPPPLPTRRKLLAEEVTSPSPPSSPAVPELTSLEDGLPPVPEEATLKLGGEARSLATSEDSGIVARPASSASKSDSVSRPESSSSSFPPFKSDFPLQKGFALTQDLLPTPDSSTAGRMSPAPSEVSKTESALSPPSHASDVSKSESARQLSLGKGSVGGSTSVSSKEGSASSSSDYSLTLLPLKKQINVKTAAIIDISCEQKTKKPESPGSLDPSPRSDGACSKKEEKPWYELSDEESDILLPDRLTTKVIPRHSSSEDETEVC